MIYLGCGLKSLSFHKETPLATYADCLNLIVCQNPTEQCFCSFRTTCKKCPDIDGLYDYLDDIFEDTEATQIVFKQWNNEPRCTLATITKSIEEFKDYFCDSI